MDSDPGSLDAQTRFFGNYDRARVTIVVVGIAPFVLLLGAAVVGGNPVIIIVLALIVGAVIVGAIMYRRVGYELDGQVLRSCHVGRGVRRDEIDLRRVHRTGPAHKVYLDLDTADDADRRAQGLGPVSITLSRMSTSAQRELRVVMEDEYGIDCSTFRTTLAERARRDT